MAPRGRALLISGASSDLASLFPNAGAIGAGGFVGLLNLPSALSFTPR